MLSFTRNREQEMSDVNSQLAKLTTAILGKLCNNTLPGDNNPDLLKLKSFADDKIKGRRLLKTLK